MIREEYEQIVTQMMPMATAAGVESNKASVFRYFIQMVRRRLHVVLSMSPVGDTFFQR